MGEADKILKERLGGCVIHLQNIFLLAISLAILILVQTGSAAFAQDSIGTIRTSSDGAGPTHLFWLSGPPAGATGADIVAIVDPLYAAVRLFSIQRLVDGDIPLAKRFQTLGACSLPVSLRPWRIHQTKQGVLVETMPDPGNAGHQAKVTALVSQYYLIKRDLKLDGLAPESDLNTNSWNPEKAMPCGSVVGDSTSLRQPFFAHRGKKNPARTIIIENTPAALSSTSPLIVRSPKDGAFWLYSARELEPAGPRRIVQIVEGQLATDGLLRLRQHILTYNNQRVIADRLFEESLVRSKLGLRPLAVMPSGELLAMGLMDQVQGPPSFAIFSCGLVDKPTGSKNNDLCSDRSNTVSGRNISDTVTPAMALEDSVQGKVPDRSDDVTIFNRTKAVRDVPWSVDTSSLPDECRAAKGCRASGGNFVPIHGIRLTRGVYSRVGMAYAQTENPKQDVDSFLALSHVSGGWKLDRASLESSANRTPGNLDDHFEQDLGIDCSALLQLAWGALGVSPRLSTETLQRSPPNYVCPDRISDPKYLKPGDAIGINIENGPHHVVIWGGALKMDGASEDWLVLESSSACGGVCWSVYDPAFFNGWGLYRSSRRSDHKCPPHATATAIASHPIPQDGDEWRKAVQDSSLWR